MDAEALASEPVDVEPEDEPEPVAEQDWPEASAFDDFEMDESAMSGAQGEGLAGAVPDRAVVGEILLALEAQNPTRSPTAWSCSRLWKFLYASALP